MSQFLDVVSCLLDLLLIHIEVAAESDQRVLNLAVLLAQLLLFRAEHALFASELLLLSLVGLLVFEHHPTLF